MQITFWLQEGHRIYYTQCVQVIGLSFQTHVLGLVQQAGFSSAIFLSVECLEHLPLSKPSCKQLFFLTVPTLSLSSETYVAVENEGSVEVCVVLNIPLSFALDFTVTTTDTGSATPGKRRTKHLI